MSGSMGQRRESQDAPAAAGKRAQPAADQSLTSTRQTERKDRRNVFLRSLSSGGKWLINTLTDSLLPGSNLLGFLVFLIVFGILAAVGGDWVNTPGEGLLNLVGGALCIGIDLGLRSLFKWLSLQQAEGGPRVVYLPLWVWGILWCISGVVRALIG
jgi:hypothetical protein